MSGASLRRVEGVSLGQLVGQRLLAVTSAVHEFDGRRSEEPVHLWLHLDGLGAVQCHTAGSGALLLHAEEPYTAYDMQEHGRVFVVDGGPPALAAQVGERIESASRLWQDPPGMTVGVSLAFPTGAVGVANLSDSLVVGAWPEAFTGQGVSEAANG